MPIWTLYGIKRGVATMSGPPRQQPDSTQSGVLGMPRLTANSCGENCSACVDSCLPGALSIKAHSSAGRIDIDYGKCIACQLCTEACPDGVLVPSQDWAFGVRNREDLVWAEVLSSEPAQDLKQRIRRYFGRSLHIRHVDAGSCNGCESELQALNNPLYNLHRLGIFFTPTPRAADLLLVTGSVTYAMQEALLETYNAMPEPKWVMATGTCAVSGGATADGYSCYRGVEDILPVDIYLPGCPPNPAAIIHALLLLLNRAEQLVQEGHYAK